MAVSLAKGGNVSLSRTSPNLNRILVGLGWDARSTTGDGFDLDASMFMVADTGKVRRDEDFVFYGQLYSPCGSVEHSPDNTTGDGDGDDEFIKVMLDQVPAGVQRLIVTVTIHDALARKQNFGQVSNAYVRIVNHDTDQEIVRFDLSEDYSTETALVFAEIYRHGGEWKFKAVGQGYAGGLEALCRQYGVHIA
jgi:tellurium resistance protein TerD